MKHEKEELSCGTNIVQRTHTVCACVYLWWAEPQSIITGGQGMSPCILQPSFIFWSCALVCWEWVKSRHQPFLEFSLLPSLVLLHHPRSFQFQELSSKGGWYLVPVFPLKSQGPGAPGLLTYDFPLPGTISREAPLPCPWSWFLDAQHSRHLWGLAISLFSGDSRSLSSLFLLPSLVWNPSFFMLCLLNPLLLGFWELRLGFQWEGCALLRHWTWM